METIFAFLYLLSQYSDLSMGWMTRVLFPAVAGERFLPFTTRSRPDLGPLSLLSKGNQGSFLGVKRSKLETEQSLRLNAAIHPLLHTSSWCRA